MNQRAATVWTRLAPLAFLPLAAALVCTPLLVGGCAPEGGTTASTPTSGVVVASTVSPTSSVPPGTSVSVSVTQPEQPDTTTTTGPRVVKIGALFPLSGDLVSVGQSALKGMRLALAEVNQNGGIAALDGALLTLAEFDSKGDPGGAKAAMEHLVKAEGVVAVVGTGQSTVALEATSAGEHLQVPFVVSSGAADEITGREFRYTFRLSPKADWYARDQVAFLLALKSLGGPDIISVALLHEKGDFGSRTADSQKAYLAAAGIKVAADIEYSADQADVDSEMIAIKQSGAQAILTATLLSDAVVIADYASVLHMNLPIVDAAGGVLAPGFMADAGASAEKILSVVEYADGSAPSLEAKLLGSGTAVDADMLSGYQAVWLLASALERAGSTDKVRLRTALATTALYGDHLLLPQSLLTFDGTGQNRRAGLLVVQVQGGRMVTVWPAEYAQGTVLLP